MLDTLDEDDRAYMIGPESTTELRIRGQETEPIPNQRYAGF